MNDNKSNNGSEKEYASTNGDKHNLIPDDPTWIEDAKEELEDYLEENGIYIRQ